MPALGCAAILGVSGAVHRAGAGTAEAGAAKAAAAEAVADAGAAKTVWALS